MLWGGDVSMMWGCGTECWVKIASLGTSIQRWDWVCIHDLGQVHWYILLWDTAWLPYSQHWVLWHCLAPLLPNLGVCCWCLAPLLYMFPFLYLPLPGFPCSLCNPLHCHVSWGTAWLDVLSTCTYTYVLSTCAFLCTA